MTAFYVNIKMVGIMSNKDTYFWKIINPQKGHPAKAAITPVNLVLQALDLKSSRSSKFGNSKTRPMEQKATS